MDSEDYYKKLDCIVGDRTRFVELDYNINTESLAECSKAHWITRETSGKLPKAVYQTIS
ncbi:MAG: hypothetical protein AAFO91_17875 [Bacteroidota bacterium]